MAAKKKVQDIRIVIAIEYQQGTTTTTTKG